MTINVMVNGIPGKMASCAALRLAKNNLFNLVAFSLSDGNAGEEYSLGERRFKLVRPGARHLLPNFDGIAVDFTIPDAVEGNVDFYCNRGMSFVLGTTGADRAKIEARVRNSDVCCVISPNMAGEIVGFQAMIKYLGENFPGLFKSYSFEIEESHQHGKKDVSGTALRMLEDFARLGVEVKEIKKIREVEKQREIGVPEEHLEGHAWHRYTIRSDSVMLEFRHNVNGREVYAKGTEQAVIYLDKKVREGNRKQVYSMIDVISQR